MKKIIMMGLVVVFSIYTAALGADNCANGDILGVTVTGATKLTKGYSATYTATPCGKYAIDSYDWTGSGGYFPDWFSGNSSKVATAGVLGSQWIACEVEDEEGNKKKHTLAVVVYADPHVTTCSYSKTYGSKNLKFEVENSTNVAIPPSVYTRDYDHTIRIGVSVEAGFDVKVVAAKVGAKVEYGFSWSDSIAVSGPEIPAGKSISFYLTPGWQQGSGNAQRWKDEGVLQQATYTDKKDAFGKVTVEGPY